MSETFSVQFHVDTECVDVDDLPENFRVNASREDPGAICITVPNVDATLIDSLGDDELAELFGIESEGLIYTDRELL
jgi:hypothetical protein